MQRPYIATLTAVFLGVAIPSSGHAEAPGGLFQRFATASETGDETTVMSLWFIGRHPWAQSGDTPGYGLFHQGQRKGFGYRLKSVRTSPSTPTRAVFETLITRQGKAVDRVSLYAERMSKSWRLVWVDESRGHAALFVAGRVAGHLDLENLGSNPSWAALSDQIRQDIDNGRVPALPGWHRAAKLFPQDTTSARVAGVHVALKLHRAALHFVVEREPSPGQRIQQEAVVYVARTNKRYQIYAAGRGLSVADFLTGWERLLAAP